MLALRGIEEKHPAVAPPKPAAAAMSFTQVLREIWEDDAARRFTWFVFIAMLAYSMQDLVLEPFAGLVFGMTPGESTKLSGLQHSGILLGMLVAGVAGSLYTKRFGENLKLWIMMGCVGSAVMLAGMAMAATIGLSWPLKANVFGLGVANGVFAVSAVGAMLGLASDGKNAGEGARMGVWGASQAIAFGLGGLIGAVIVDQLRRITGEDSTAFVTVFALEAALFLFAAIVATGTPMQRRSAAPRAVTA
jgi:BCD family chlorophyll transporter-like MFS transporter